MKSLLTPHFHGTISGSGAASTAPTLTGIGGSDMTYRTCSIDGCSNRHLSRGLCNMHYHRLRKYGSPTGGPPRQERTREVLRGLLALQTDECLLWPRGKEGGGYGSVCIDGVVRRASVVACESLHGQRPTSHHQAAHSCGKPACVNPRHLRWATPTENAADRLIHDTHARGERSAKAKLSTAQVVEIRSSNALSTELARRFNVSADAVRSVRARNSWAWL